MPLVAIRWAMDSVTATREFVGILRLGSAALQNVLKSDKRAASEFGEEFSQIFFLLDSLDEVGQHLEEKVSKPQVQSGSF